jgi:hypothetical protein
LLLNGKPGIIIYHPPTLWRDETVQNSSLALLKFGFVPGGTRQLIGANWLCREFDVGSLQTTILIV